MTLLFFSHLGCGPCGFVGRNLVAHFFSAITTPYHLSNLREIKKLTASTLAGAFEVPRLQHARGVCNSHHQHRHPAAFTLVLRAIIRAEMHRSGREARDGSSSRDIAEGPADRRHQQTRRAGRVASDGGLVRQGRWELSDESIWAVRGVREMSGF